MPYTNRSDPKENPWYPRGASDLADALIDAINNDIAETKRALELDEFSRYRQDSFLRD